MTHDDLTRYAIAQAYGNPAGEVTDGWRPYRMWTVVVLHMWVRAEVGLPPRRQASASAR
jgi:hypothetical protein